MAIPLKDNSQKLFEQLSKLKGSQASLKRVKSLVAAADLQQNRGLVRRSLRLMNGIIHALKKAAPNLPPELVGGFAANLLDLWETGQKLDERLRELSRLHSPRDRERLRDCLIWIDAIQIDMGSYWIEEVEKVLPKILRGLDRQERNEHKRLRRVANSSARHRSEHLHD
jgi:hypothetical protein